MAELVQVVKREGSMGTSASRRLRKTGQVPAVLYGHKQANEHLTISKKTVESILRHHSKIVELQGAVNETALVSDLQFDPLGIDVLHIDLQRVDMNEKVTVTVAIKFKGEAAGTKQGGMAIENQHEVEISCPAVAIPEFVIGVVTGVESGSNLTAGQLDMPENVELVTPSDTVVFHVAKPKGRSEDDEEEEAAAE